MLGLDGDGRQVDALTTNPGHALWCGIADDDKARTYVERLVGIELWTGWGLRTLATTMGAYDPLSYHNGSVWPHDTAICIAGAARYGCWDAVDLLVDGALEAASHFDGRPPELFAGVSRDDVPVPVAYPSSCSPQAWASASVLLNVRSMLGLQPTADRSGLELARYRPRRCPGPAGPAARLRGQEGLRARRGWSRRRADGVRIARVAASLRARATVG